MGDIFISHVEENSAIAIQIAEGLEQAGYDTWCYERDAVPGPSYLLQTARQIEASRAVVLLISPDSLGSHQVTAEVVRAHESGTPFVPVLIGISHVEFAARQPEWREALGSSTSITLPDGDVAGILPRILEGLRGLGITPHEGHEAAPAGPALPYVAFPTATTPRRGWAPGRGKVLVIAAAVGVALLVAGVALLGGGGDGDQRTTGTTTGTTTVGSSSTAPSSSAPSRTTAPTTTEEARSSSSFRSASDTPVSTSAGSLQVTSAALTQRACPPPGIPGDCLVASGSDRYLMLNLVPSSGGSAAMTQVFAMEAQQSSLSFGGGLEAGTYSVSLNQGANRIEVVYGVLPASAVSDEVLLHWPGNAPLLLPVTG